jgi:hypothetical protein
MRPNPRRRPVPRGPPRRAGWGRGLRRADRGRGQLTADMHSRTPGPERSTKFTVVVANIVAYGPAQERVSIPLPAVKLS